MPLLAIWRSTPAVVAQFTVEQVVSTAGNGDLRDGSECSSELRAYFKESPTSRLAGYIEHCLTRSFAKSGQVLQDLVNELGRRLGYVVEDGRYQGVVNGIGFDGIWRAPESNDIIIETKTTDTYRLSLDKIVEYRSALIELGRIRMDSSILIVTGRIDTGELEAQIRGSRHAWDIRLISADALLNLVNIKETTDSNQTVEKMRRLLIPTEFTRLDKLIDVIFTTAQDVESAVKADSGEKPVDDEESSNEEPSRWQFTDPKTLNAKREKILTGLSVKLAVNFIRYSRALFWDASHKIRVAVTLSKRYERKKGQAPYWYAYHPQWDNFLGDGDGYLVLGCVDLDVAFAIPVETLRQWLPSFLTSQSKDGAYWHVKLVEQFPQQYAISLPRNRSVISLMPFQFSATPSNSDQKLQVRS